MAYVKWQMASFFGVENDGLYHYHESTRWKNYGVRTSESNGFLMEWQYTTTMVKA